MVNLRALPTERRKIRLSIEIDTALRNQSYAVDYILGDSTRILEPDASHVHSGDTRVLDVSLDPGDAELIHFYRNE